MKSWDDYLIPGTQLLRNKPGLTEEGAIGLFEKTATTLRHRELASGIANVPSTFDQDHVKAIHHHLFQDVYDWAGQYRTVNIQKHDLIANEPKLFAHHTNIPAALDITLTAIRDHNWDITDPRDFARDMAAASTYLNYAHPFREGNGRTHKVLLTHIAEQSPYRLDYDRALYVQWVRAHTIALPQHLDNPPHLDGLIRTFEKITVPRHETASEGRPELCIPLMERIQNNVQAAKVAEETTVPAMDPKLAAARRIYAASFPVPAGGKNAQTINDLQRARAGEPAVMYKQDRSVDRAVTPGGG